MSPNPESPQWLRLALFIFILFGTILGALSIPVVVKLRENAIFPCNATCNGRLLWTFNTNNEKLDVLTCFQKNCTEGANFKNRTTFTEDVKHGKLSLNLSSVVYNDEGRYRLRCDSEYLCSYHLEVFVPSVVNATIRHDVTLPCYAHTEKQITDDAVDILWMRDDQTVLQVQRGITTYGVGFQGRASVSLPHYKDGNLSLHIHGVTAADEGLYRCYHKTEEHGQPRSVILNVTAHPKSYAKKQGDTLLLDLFGSDCVRITFNGSSEVCRAIGKTITCAPEYTSRASITNNTFKLTSSDRGTYTVSDCTGDVLDINRVEVEGVDHRYRYITIAPAALIVLGCICLWYKYHGQTQAEGNQVSYNAGDSSVSVEQPSLEPAYIRLPEQETSPFVSEEPEEEPHLAVEESALVLEMSEKQHSIELEEIILPPE